MKCPQRYLTEMQEVILFYNGLGIPTRQILDSGGAIPSKTAADAKVAIQEMAEYSQKWHNGTSKSRSTKTFDGLAAIQAQLNNLGREIKKVNEKFYAAQVGCEQCKGPHYTKDCPLKEEGKTLKEAYYTQFGGPFQGGGYRAAALGFYQRNNVNPSYQERRQSMEDTLSKFMSELAKRHEENSNFIKEIRASTDAAIRNQGASIKTLEIQNRKMSQLIHARYAVLDPPNTPYPLDRIGSYGPQFSEAYSEASQSIPQKEKDPGSFTLPCFINNICFDNTLVDLGASTEDVKDILKGIAENMLVSIGKFVFPVDFIILDMLEDIRVPLILGRPFLSIARAKIDVYKRNITLRVREERIIFTSNFGVNRSLDTFFEDYIELNDLNEPFELRRNQGDDLMPTIKEGEVIEEFRTRDDELDAVIDDYPSYCDYDKKIHIDCAHNLKFSCMIGFEFTHANVFPLLYVNVMSKKFHNSIMKDKMVYKGNNVIGALMNVPIFVGTFSVVTDFAVLENMDAYRNEGMGDVIFGEPFLREVGINAKRFEVMITIYNDNDEVTYQMVRSHPRFKYHTNEQCNKIPPLLRYD
ncbi:putative reverse transcriptase domain-containing protein [Tanacetum coccineum]